MSQVVVCIPAYNAESTISRTLDTIVSQDIPILKIKVFDNLSSDRTQKIVKEYAAKYSNVELYVNEKNVGAEGNFTRCMQAAEGDYCAILHSNDLYEKSFLSSLTLGLDENKGAVAAFCGAFEINQDEDIIGERFYPAELAQNEMVPLGFQELVSLVFKYGNFITCPAVVVRSSIYKDQICHWNGDQFKSSADLDVWLRLSQYGKILAVKKIDALSSS